MKILVPIDGSQNALNAVKYAAVMAKTNADVQITLMYVVILEANNMRVQNFEQTYKGEADTVFAPAKELLADAPIPPAFYIARGVNAASQILEYAEAEGFDGIVMGSRGLSDLKRFFVGSVSTRVSQNAPCTVTLVK